jgi:hypothetical protein
MSSKGIAFLGTEFAVRASVTAEALTVTPSAQVKVAESTCGATLASLESQLIVP